MLNRIASSVAYRAKWARLGVFYAHKFPRLDHVRIAGRDVDLSFPDNERDVHEHEFSKIVIEDCYRLRDIRPPVQTILDIGANIGLFALAARNRFPRAMIHCYEPNPALAQHLAAHCDAIVAQRHMEAVGRHDGKISLRIEGGSLHSVAQATPEATIPQISFARAVAKLGRVDLLKLDCEGAEWDIFTDPGPWQCVRSLVMEYHLWAKPGSAIQTVEQSLRSIGFSDIDTEPCGNDPWGLAFASKV